MKLHPYLISLAPADRETFARLCGTSLNYLWKIAYRFDEGLRPSAELATQIELRSNLTVRRWECIPERWHRIWPELRGVEGAPVPPDERLAA